MNTFFVLVDCLRADRAFGDGSATIPTLASLRARGVSFSTCISAASTTTPCVGSILTGLYPSGHGIRALRGFVLRRDVGTMAQVLREAGYHTYAYVTGPLYPETGLDRGFTEYHHRGRRVYLDGAWGQQLLADLAGSRFREPWFLFLHLFELHRPRHVPPEFRRRRFGRNSYDRALSALDHHLGALFGAVSRDTLIILTGDHGENIQETRFQEFAFRLRYRLRHRFGLDVGRDIWGHGYHVYDFLVRVPLIFYHHSLLAAGRTSVTLVRHVDILPTLVDLLGLPPVPQVDGASLRPLLGGEVSPARVACMEAVGGLRTNDPTIWLAGIRTETHKFVYGPYSARVPEELYDLRADPQERRNIAARQPALAAALKAQLVAARGPAGHTVPQPNAMYTPDEEAAVTARLRDLGYI